MTVAAWDLGNTIRSSRIKKGYTQEALSELLDITPSHLKQMEGGRRNPSVPLLFQMMELLDFSVDALAVSYTHLEKQKVKFVYGIMEKQFRMYYEKAARMPGKTGENLLTFVERRLDNVVYRLGFAMTRREARQLVGHGHFTVNGQRVDIPSYLVKAGDMIEVKESSR